MNCVKVLNFVFLVFLDKTEICMYFIKGYCKHEGEQFCIIPTETCTVYN